MKLQNFENINEHRRLYENYERIQESLREINEMLANKDKYHLSDGGVCPKGKKPLYALHICVYSDGSGTFNVDLTGLQLHFELLEAIKGMLERNLVVLKKQIEEL